ncbi:NAD(P)/FAD-dependent oxidoreductase [Rhizobium sp. CC-YZS058]|uniref:NAD(P)/FAD-dependent oxidoreductase n=1 Tax=Rhizobium sp. CC-YZS058 TaxID=3042153 RepID=UPI002B0551C9|nr:NAD(P)/FAD-dependent oxidoreductase [Rhizobium sp. CC-YZS058]MEA3536012.1 NAD(P)/FAD-dependent oxidoreductase [Rhizobium sp. CC-YZS058]
MAETVDVIILGAGAAGMMAAIEAARRGRRVLVLDHAKAPGEKIRISGGGRCNFTNLGTTAANFLSANPHFAKSALARYTPRDFLAMVETHRIAWHEKTLGQLFCDESAKDIIRMLLSEMRAAGAELRLETAIQTVEKDLSGFRIESSAGTMHSETLIVATGGKSIPKMGATGLAYRIAESFGLELVETRPGLVPLTLADPLKEALAPLAGVGVPVRAKAGKARFEEAMLFTHRGLSGPAILQISSYWREGEAIEIAFTPQSDLAALLKSARKTQGRQVLRTVLGDFLPKRLANHLAGTSPLGERPLADLSDKAIEGFASDLSAWPIRPAGSEGYRTAEVTLGGVDTRALDSRTMMARAVPGLFFIGECVDVTGWLGGYNFQWAWSSGFSAGQAA